MASGGPEAGQPVGSAGEALTHFRDDVEDVAQFIDGIVDVSAGLVFTVARRVRARRADTARRRRAAAPAGRRRAGDPGARRPDQGVPGGRSRGDRPPSPGCVGDVMAAATTVKVNGATDTDAGPAAAARRPAPATPRSATVSSTRACRRSARAPPTSASAWCCWSAPARMASGTFGVGELALFTAYLGWLSFLPRMVGRVLARRKQAGVAFDRMRRLVADEASRQHRAAAIAARSRPRQTSAPARRRASASGCRSSGSRWSACRPATPAAPACTTSIVHASSAAASPSSPGPSARARRTLLRAMLGLAHQAEVTGEVRWNGERASTTGRRSSSRRTRRSCRRCRS